MKDAKPTSPDPRALRQHAEQKLREQHPPAEQPPSEIDARELVHELEVHQIELEMQNEELHCAQIQAQEAADKYTDLFDFAPLGYFQLTQDAVIREANLAGAALLGFERSRVVSKRFDAWVAPASLQTFANFRKAVLASDTKQTCEIQLLCPGRVVLDVQLEGLATPAQAGLERTWRLAVLNVTLRKQAEAVREQHRQHLEGQVQDRDRQLEVAGDQLQAEQAGRKADEELAASFLRLINESRGTRELIQAITGFFQQQSGCQAVGVRLKVGDDYPYYETRGFPKEFVLLENQLCARDDKGRPLLDAVGHPVLDCMCGNVICGRFDPTKPFFTTHGTFWTNGTTELLATTTEADRQARTRNRCNGEGYESVALIALRSGQQTLGLLQLNDRRKDRFTPESIALWERLAGYLAVAVAKSRAEDELRISNKELEKFNNAMVGRELRMIELKKEIDALCVQFGQPPRYYPKTEG